MDVPVLNVQVLIDGLELIVKHSDGQEVLVAENALKKYYSCPKCRRETWQSKTHLHCDPCGRSWHKVPRLADRN